MKLPGTQKLRALAARLLAGEDKPAPLHPPKDEGGPIPRAFEAGAADAALRVLVVADAFAATQQISFVDPLADRCARGDARLVIVAERDIDAMGRASFAAAFAHLMTTERPTVVAFSRAGTRFVGDILDAARAAGARVVAHLDDDLFAVPDMLGAAKSAQHNDPARVARLMIACRRADAIYASTPALGDALAARFPDRVVTAGRIYAAAREPFQPFTPGARVFGYMGTAGHGADLAVIAPAVAAVLARVPTARFETFGTIKMPESLAAFGERAVALPKAAGYGAFMEKLKGLGWTAGLAPLNDSPFNACKADTKFVEYAQAGIPAVLARLPVYARPLDDGAALSATTQDEWTDAIVQLLEDDAKAAALAARGQDLLRRAYGVEALERQLLGVLGA